MRQDCHSTTGEANKAIERVLASRSSGLATKNEYTADFTPKDHSDIGQYVLENGNAMRVITLKKKKTEMWSFQCAIKT